MKRIMGIVLILLLALVLPAAAQDNAGTPIDFTGVVEKVDGSTITVSGLTVDISSMDSTILANIEPGIIVTINGNLSNTVVIAIAVEMPGDDNNDEPDPTDPPDSDTPDDSGITVEVFVSVDGGITWVASDGDIAIEDGAEVLVRFIVTNNSDTPLTALDLSGTNFDIGDCEIPETLEAGADFECTATLSFEEGDADAVALAVVVAGDLDGTAVEVTETTVVSNEQGDNEDETGVIIIIEGPVTEIEGNVITIFSFKIVLADNDPRLIVIQIGDVLRIEGQFGDGVIIAVVFIFIDIDVFVFEGEVWRDSGNCNNAPPPWAPANGWRRRCETSSGGGGGGGGRGNGGSGKKHRGGS